MAVRRPLRPGSRPLDIAKSIGQRLADDADVARVNDQMWDLTRPVEGDRVQRFSRSDVVVSRIEPLP